MNVEHLRTLVAIVEHGSLSGAARALHITQPAVTKQVQRLEQELEAALLVRGPQQRVMLTPAGERVLAFAQATLASLAELEEGLALQKTVTQGSLALAASTIPGEYVVPGLLAAFHDQYPQVRLQLTIADTVEVAERVLADQADVGFIGAAVDRPGLRLERLAGDEIVLAVPRDHPFARRERVTPDMLSGQPVIVREEGSGTRRTVERALAAAASALGGTGESPWLPRDNVALTLGSTQAVLRAVAQGLGIGFVSDRAAAQEEAVGHVACVRLEGVDLRRDLYLAYLPERLAEPLIAHFLAFARARTNG